MDKLHDVTKEGYRNYTYGMPKKHKILYHGHHEDYGKVEIAFQNSSRRSRGEEMQYWINDLETGEEYETGETQLSDITQHIHRDPVNLSGREIKTSGSTEYTVVGTSAHHPNGFTRVVEADSPAEAPDKIGHPNQHIIAVLEGVGENQLAQSR